MRHRHAASASHRDDVDGRGNVVKNVGAGSLLCAGPADLACVRAEAARLLRSGSFELSLQGVTMKARRFQDLSRFGGTARGGAAWRAQLWWLFQAVFVLPTPQYMFAWRRLALIMF